MFTLIWDRDRDQDSLFPIAPDSLPEPVLVPFPCSMKKPQDVLFSVSQIGTETNIPVSAEHYQIYSTIVVIAR